VLDYRLENGSAYPIISFFERCAMPVAAKISESVSKSSWIRRMFEEGLRLKAQFGNENVFDFSLGNPDLSPPAEFNDTLKARVEKNEGGVHGYMPNAGFDGVRAAIAERVSKEQGVDVQGRHIITSCGAAGALNVILKTILNPDDEVIVPKPYFVEYGAYIDNHRGRIVLVDTNPDFSLNIDNIRAALNGKTRAVLINSPNNPTGRVYAEKDIAALGALIKEHMESTGRIVYLVSDEPYREIVYDGVKAPSILKHCRQAIVVTSYSKTLSIAGERIGYIAVHPGCAGVEALLGGLILSTRILGFVNAPALMQRAVARLGGVSVDMSVYKNRRDLLMSGLESAGYDFARPEGAFYIFCKSPIPDDVAFVGHLQKFNVLTVPGSGFGGPGYFRIAYCVSEGVIQRAAPKFREALEALKT